MSPGEVMFLGMVIGALSIFAITMAYASWVASGSSRQPKRNAAARKSRPHSIDLYPTIR